MPIVSSYAGESHWHAVNLRYALAKVAIGEFHLLRNLLLNESSSSI